MDARHETYPGELDVCDVCGEVFRDNERGLVHGCFTLRGDAFRDQLVDLARQDEKAGRYPDTFHVGAELFNALAREVPSWFFAGSRRLVQLRRLSPLKHARGGAPAWIAIGFCQLAVMRAELPIWAARLRRRTLHYTLGVDRALEPQRLAGMHVVTDVNVPRGVVRIDTRWPRTVDLNDTLKQLYPLPGPSTTARGRQGTPRGGRGDDGSRFNGTPRALRTTRRPWER